MNRRSFCKAAGLSLPLFHASSVRAMETVTTSSSRLTSPAIEKARLAMLCNQRDPWEQGVASQALMELGDDDSVVLMAYEAVLRQHPDGRLGLIGGASTVTDPVSNGPAVLHAYRITQDEKLKAAADKQYRFLKDKAPKTDNGTLRHFTNSTQVWSDSTFMAPPFLAYYGDTAEAVKQLKGFMGYLWDADKHMMCHMWDDQKQKFNRQACWGGGNGWTAAGIALVIDQLPATMQADKDFLVTRVTQLLKGCLAHMRSDGLFHDVIDDSNTFVETNLSQMLAFTIYRGVRSGWLDTNFLSSAHQMRKAAQQKMDSLGRIQGACSSPQFNRPGTSTEAQAFFLMMEAAYMKLKAVR